MQSGGEILTRENLQRKLRIGHRNRRGFRTVRGNRQEQHVLVQVHPRGEALQRIPQPGHARERSAIQIPFVIDQRQMPVADAEPLSHYAGSQADFLRKHFLIADACKAQEKRFGVRRMITLDGLERRIDSIRLFE